MQNTSSPVGTTKRYARSRVSNGTGLFGGKVDERSTWARRLRDLIELHISDLGGADATSAAEKSIVRRAATLTVELERLEARFALAGEATADDLDLYQRTAGNLRRLLEAVGLQRRARDVTPDLHTYLATAAKPAAVTQDSFSAVSATTLAPDDENRSSGHGAAIDGASA